MRVRDASEEEGVLAGIGLPVVLQQKGSHVAKYFCRQLVLVGNLCSVRGNQQFFLCSSKAVKRNFIRNQTSQSESQSASVRDGV